MLDAITCEEGVELFTHELCPIIAHHGLGQPISGAPASHLLHSGSDCGGLHDGGLNPLRMCVDICEYFIAPPTVA